MSNYCACSGGDEEYTIELNQQGPEGPQGEVGPEGFSPSISVKTNTDRSYILTVVNKEGTFDTPNLYGEIEKLNADLSNIPNPAFINGISLASIEDNIPMITMDSSRITTNVDGNLILNATASKEETMEVFNYEVVANPKEQRLELHDNEGNVKIVATTDNIPTINVATTTTAGVVKPDGSTITVGADGTISAVQQDLSNYVTNDELSVDLQYINSKIASKLDTATYEADKTTYATKDELASTDTTVASIQTNLNSKLESSNIIAGANITIDRNGNNLTINSIGGGGGGGVSIDDSTISSASTWSSSKINSEITTEVDTINSTKNDNIFDIGKFEVKGTLTITNDGVASGFNKDNYIRINKSFDTSKPWSIKKKFTMPTTACNIIGSNNTGFLIVVDYTYPQPILKVQLSKTNSKWDITAGTGGSGLVAGQEYYLILEYNLTNYKIKLSTDGINYTDYLTVSSSDNILTPSYITIGTWSIYGASSNLVEDLKYFAITVDGEEIFNGFMESTKPIYDKLSFTSSELSTFQTDTNNNFSAVNSALNEKANLSDLAGYVPLTKYNELLARVVALETEINGGNA